MIKIKIIILDLFLGDSDRSNAPRMLHLHLASGGLEKATGLDPEMTLPEVGSISQQSVSFSPAEVQTEVVFKMADSTTGTLSRTRSKMYVTNMKISM